MVPEDAVGIPYQLEERTIHLNQERYFIPYNVSEDDQLSQYLRQPMAPTVGSLMQSDFGVMRFWLKHAIRYLFLRKLAFRIFATLPSSVAIGRDFIAFISFYLLVETFCGPVLWHT